MHKNYDRVPFVAVEGYEGEVWSGYRDIGERLAALKRQKKLVIVLECYPGVRYEEVLGGLKDRLNPVALMCADEAARPLKELEDMLTSYLTEDRVFGRMYPFDIRSFFDVEKLRNMAGQVCSVPEGVVLVYGTGASLVCPGDVLIYADLARWEIQQRYRSGEIGNWLTDNRPEDPLRKYKRGFFVEWRVADRHKKEFFQRVDFFLDTNKKDSPKMAAGNTVRAGMAHAVTRPFRVAPYFDSGVWGGRWMRERFGLPDNGSNYAWGFDCVPEENSLLLRFGEVIMEFPAMDLVLFWPKELLGEQVFARFGAEFPIRFDLLDTVGGQNLSLQVHPQTAYIQEQFGMHYTQDESYYILDCEPDTEVFLGLREDVDPDVMLAELREAQRSGSFDAARHGNRLPVKKHDHFLIPAGTVHCSGAGTMVLEISATPYIFTFKLWDWGRLGLDGLPRPVHLTHGEKNIRFERTRMWIEENCACIVQPVAQGSGWREERTGLHANEFIETRRHWFTRAVRHRADGNVHVLNLVQGEAAVVESPDNRFDPFEVHYAETFILPAGAGDYIIRPLGGEEMATIKAYVRFDGGPQKGNYR
jgi:mannose-6-phosphate isomerase class I